MKLKIQDEEYSYVKKDWEVTANGLRIQVLWGRGLIVGKTLPNYDIT